MIILDHNIPRTETEKLRKHRIRFRQIGMHIGRPEWDDMQEILRYLHRKRGATFFTRDLGFYRARLRHRSYCIVVIDDVDPFQKHVYIYRPGEPVECLQAPNTVSGDPTLPVFVLQLSEVWQ